MQMCCWLTRRSCINSSSLIGILLLLICFREVASDEIEGQLEMPVVRGTAVDDIISIPIGNINRKLPQNNNFSGIDGDINTIGDDSAAIINDNEIDDNDEEEVKMLEKLAMANNNDEGKAIAAETNSFFEKIVGKKCPQLFSTANRHKLPLTIKTALVGMLLFLSPSGGASGHGHNNASAVHTGMMSMPISSSQFPFTRAEKCPTWKELERWENDYNKESQFRTGSHGSPVQNSVDKIAKFELDKKRKNIKKNQMLPTSSNATANNLKLKKAKGKKGGKMLQLSLHQTPQARLERIFDIVLDITGADSSMHGLLLPKSANNPQNWTSRKDLAQKLAQKWAEEIENTENIEKLTDIELGKMIVQKLCGQACFQIDQLPAYGVQRYGKESPPKEKDVQHVLRPYLLRMAQKFGTGRLWVDNPLAEHKNGFMIGYEFDETTKSKDVWVFEEHYLRHFQRIGPFIFVDVAKNSTIEFKHVLHFVVTETGETFAPNGLDRSKREQIVQFPGEHPVQLGKYMDELDFFNLLAKALCAECGHNIDIDYGDGVSETMRMLTRLNAAYGAEDYFIFGYSHHLFKPDDPLSVELAPTTLLWTDYPDCKSRKYEVPVFIKDEKLKFLLTQKSKLQNNKFLHLFYKLDLQEVFDEFERNSVLRFKLVEEAPDEGFYVKITEHPDEWKTEASVGHSSDAGARFYWGEPFYLGIRRVYDKHVLFHELLHFAGLSHEQQRMDAAEHVKYNMHVFDEERAGRKSEINKEIYNETLAINYGRIPTYRLPFRPYNTESIMHSRGKEFSNPELSDDNYSLYPTKPHQWDWDNLNALYGLAPGETKFNAEQVGQCKMSKKQ